MYPDPINSVWLCGIETNGEVCAEAMYVRLEGSKNDIAHFLSGIVSQGEVDEVTNTDETSELRLVDKDPNPFSSWHWERWPVPELPLRNPREVFSGDRLVGLEYSSIDGKPEFGMYSNVGSQFIFVASGMEAMQRTKTLLEIV